VLGLILHLLQPRGEEKLSDSFLSITGNTSITYNFTENINAYANIAKGRRPNIISFNGKKPFVLDEEILISYEVGSKWLLFEDKLQISGAAFYYDYLNFRTPISDNVENGMLSFSQEDSGSATVRGGELSVSYLFANYSHLETAFDDVDKNGVALQYAGNQFRQAPKNSFSVGGNFQTRGR